MPNFALIKSWGQDALIRVVLPEKKRPEHTPQRAPAEAQPTCEPSEPRIACNTSPISTQREEENGRAERKYLKHVLCTKTVSSMAVIQAHNWLVVGSSDGTVELWDSAKGKLDKSLTGLNYGAGTVVLLGDGCTLAAESYQHKITLWHSETGSTQRKLVGHTDVITCLVVLNDGL